MTYSKRPTTSRKVLVSVASLLSVASVALCASAGQANPRTATCQFYSDGAGYCSGTLRAFRNSTDASAYLILQSYGYSGGISRYVVAKFAGTYKYLPLSASLPESVLTLFDAAAVAVDSNIYVHWNTSSQVDTIQFFNDSGLL
ncbi:MAG: hypothetical protein QM784_17490 [Polyangiaceae bacterium]